MNKPIVRTYNFNTSFKLTVAINEIRIKFQKGASEQRCNLLEKEILRIIEGVDFGDSTFRGTISDFGFTMYDGTKKKQINLYFSEEFIQEWKSYEN